jgi:putative addiction module component (TIGR02574 family)
MPPTLQDFGLDRLDVEDRIALAHALWDSAADEIEHMPLSDAQRQELERRLADSIARPDAVTPWEEVKARALTRARK